MLILFDIDLTLVRTNGAGLDAILAAGRHLHGPAFQGGGVSVAGRIDPLIVRDLLAANGVEPSPAAHAALRAGYRERLPGVLAERGASALPGVVELTFRLMSLPTVTLGLLTGNFPETGRAKLEAAGIDPEWYPVQVWGDDSPHEPPSRDHLPGVGIERYERHTGRAIDGAGVTIIGDTPHDVACARAHGCRSLAVATGRTSADELVSAGADATFDDLADTEGVMAWLMG